MFIGTTAVVLTVVLAAFGFLRSRMRPRFSYIAQPLPDADFCAMAAKPGWRAHSLSVAPGVELRGLLREPATPAGPWVIFFSGNSAHLLSEGQQVLETLCAERGWGGAVWAYRGYDSSGGTPDPATLEGDGFKAYCALLAERQIPPAAVHLVGFSLGTAFATAVAARAHQDPPASLTLLAPMTQLYVGERTQLRLHRYATLKWLRAIANPTLVIHGTSDTTLGVENGRAVVKALGSF
jgi:pimeloyl-ACP methyl ester carboxylesterase